eukprot:7591453-Alexandrium_andersonii.AAC.1
MPGAGAASRFGRARAMPGEWRAHLGSMRPHSAQAVARVAGASDRIPARAGLARTVLAGSSSQRGADTHVLTRPGPPKSRSF